MGCYTYVQCLSMFNCLKTTSSLWFQEVKTSGTLVSTKHEQHTVVALLVLNKQNGKGMDKLQITTPRK